MVNFTLGSRGRRCKGYIKTALLISLQLLIFTENWLKTVYRCGMFLQATDTVETWANAYHWLLTYQGRAARGPCLSIDSVVTESSSPPLCTLIWTSLLSTAVQNLPRKAKAHYKQNIFTIIPCRHIDRNCNLICKTACLKRLTHNVSMFMLKLWSFRLLERWEVIKSWSNQILSCSWY